MIYFVSNNGCDNANGTLNAPFKTISHAAKIAKAGDTVKVRGGVYREYIDPENGGEKDRPIIYEGYEGERPVIKGSEVVTDWEHVSGTVWHKSIENSLFGDFNPFATPVFGDWLVLPEEREVHLGDVYLKGTSLYEATDMDALYKAEMRTEGAHYTSPSYTHTENIRYPEETVYQWYATVGDAVTELYCNFGKYDPNKELTEISVRQCCFFPSKTGVNYITVRGFEMAHGATQWAPPTGDQYGIIGPHWSLGWIIEDNIVHDAKCSAINLGKICDGKGNTYTRFGRKAGYFNQMEITMEAARTGWEKTNVGSHAVRNNVIYNCGQGGIIGHMGCAFSKIEHNHIYNVNTKQEFWGHEVAGIKLHAAIDTVIENNNVHNCNLGIWLDWQAQGTRLTRNVFHKNIRDMFIEVTHGPLVIDNNIFLSPLTVMNAAQSTAYVNNIMTGLMHYFPVLERATPYHAPHSTDIVGLAMVYSGDDRVYNNIITAPMKPYSEKLAYFGSVYDKQLTLEERNKIIAIKGCDGIERFCNLKLPIYISGNAYAGYSLPFRAEEEYVRADGVTAEIIENGNEWSLSLFVPEALANAKFDAVTAGQLGVTLLSECKYEDPHGNPVDLSCDMLGEKREEKTSPGAFASLKAGINKITVWRA